MPSSPRLSPDDLTQIRQNTNWRDLFTALSIQKDANRSKDHDWWGKSPFRPSEHTASFHINARGWYCHSTNQGGGPLELVQRLHKGMTCYQAGRWLLERGLSRIVNGTREDLTKATTDDAQPDKPPPKNPPIRQDLRKYLLPGHPTFEERGIPDRVLCDLGAGYLDRPPRKSGRPDPMNQRLVFQIRGFEKDESGELQPTILGHIGRATSPEQEKSDGKWWTYAGFRKSFELFQQDLVLLDEEAQQQARDSGWLLLVEGCFDIAKLRAAGIKNAVASFGATLSSAQVDHLSFLLKRLGIEQVRLCFDRDEAGDQGTAAAFERLSSAGIIASAFNWDQTWKTAKREEVGIPDSIRDPADFSVGQLQWLRKEGVL